MILLHPLLDSEIAAERTFAWEALGCKLIHSHDLIADCVQNDLAHRMQVELAHEIAPVSLRCFDAASQDHSHFLRRFALRDQLKHFPLPTRQSWQSRQTGGRKVAVQNVL